MMSKKRIKGLAAAAVLSAGIVLGSLSALAATGTITASNVNVRADASTSASIVGTANTGESFTVGDSKVDAEGKTWYQITLASGNIGYVRSDFISVAEDPEPAYTEEPPAAEPAAPASTEPASSSTGDYQLVMAADENGNDTLYLYNNAAGERMKLSDIEGLQTQLAAAQKEAKNAGNRYKVLLIVLIVLLAIAVAGCVLLFLRLRDALSSGRRERDLTSERRSARRSDSAADSVSSLRRGAEGQRRPGAAPQARRNDAYASGARRVEGGAAQVRSGRPQGAQGAAPRPQQAAGQDPYQRVRTQERPAAPARPSSQDGTRVAPAQGARAQAGQGAAAQPAARRPQPKNFADDDGFDYDFIKLDDKN